MRGGQHREVAGCSPDEKEIRRHFPEFSPSSRQAGSVTRKHGKTFFAFILIALLGLAVYSNSFRVPFQFDDNSSIVNNQVIRNLGNFTSSLDGYHYNPRRVVGYATFALNYDFGDLDPTGYHVVNFAVHIMASFLVYLLVMLTLKTPYFKGDRAKSMEHGTTESDPDTLPAPVSSSASDLQPLTSTLPAGWLEFFIALFSALLFVSHPLQTESVTYIVQRFASLATMFYLLSFVLYISGRLIQFKADTESASYRGNAKALILAISCFVFSFLSGVLAMGTKETAYTLPFMLVIFELFFFTSETGRRRLFLLTTVAVAGVSAVIFFIKSGMSPGDMMSRLSALTMVQSSGSRWIYFLTELRVIASYIRLTFFPVNQTIDYDFPIYHSFFAPQVLLSACLLLALLGAAVYLLVRSRVASGKRQISPYYRLAAFGIFWFFIALSVESSFITIADVIFEHRMYLPSVGAMIAITALSFTLAGHLARNGRRTVVIIFTVIVTLFGAASYARNEVWASPVSLWKDAIRKAPGLARPYFSLGAEYARLGAYEKAIGMYKKALAMPPGEYLELRADEYPKMYNAVGLLYASLGRYDKAIDVFQGLLRRYPDFTGAYNNLGAAYLNSGRYREAIRPLLQALDRKPDNLEARYNLALAYYGSGDRDAAMHEAATIKRFSPELASRLLSQIR